LGAAKEDACAAHRRPRLGRARRAVTAYIANSALTRASIAEFYGRDAPVVHPPVEIDRFTVDPDPRDAFLVAGEITPHKNVELALEAAARAGVRVRVVGDGPESQAAASSLHGAAFPVLGQR
jgi:glycosyltransferase involved in cell wall biosynthesis